MITWSRISPPLHACSKTSARPSAPRPTRAYGRAFLGWLFLNSNRRHPRRQVQLPRAGQAAHQRQPGVRAARLGQDHEHHAAKAEGGGAGGGRPCRQGAGVSRATRKKLTGPRASARARVQPASCPTWWSRCAPNRRRSPGSRTRTTPSPEAAAIPPAPAGRASRRLSGSAARPIFPMRPLLPVPARR